MDFNFNSLSEQNFAGNSTKYLQPYEIYKVNLTKIEKKETKGKKDPNAVYHVIALEFTGEDGVFETNLFIPSKDEDMKRPTFQNSDGHEYNRPSRFENFQFTLMQIVHALNPAGEQKIKDKASKIKSMDTFVDLIIKALSNVSKVETNLKLVGRNNEGKVYTALPNACGLNKEGEIFPINFIGENLFFTNYELTQQKNFKNASPTNMDKVENNPDESNDTIDLSGIEL